MFTPIKNLITYIQKNASGNSIFGGNCTTEESTKMETENTEREAVNEYLQTETDFPKEIDKEDKIEKNEENTCEQTKDSISDLKDSGIKTATFNTTTTESAEYLCELEDDIESQIERSIMLKTPVRTKTKNCSEILELKKSPNDNCKIVSSHDYNRYHSLSPIDDELNDFRHDPVELLRTNSSPCSYQHVDEFCSVGSAEEASERDFKTIHDYQSQYENDNKTEDEEQKRLVDSELEVEDIETENEQNDVIEVEDEEEPFLVLQNYKSSNVLVLDEIDLNASTASVDTNNTTEDPLAIACEEQEAFAADKAAALEELNLLNSSQNSQDDDTRTTADEDLRWLKTDLDDNQPSCSSKVELKDSTTVVTPEKEERNGEGSDSGLGSETSVLHTTTTSITDTSQLNTTTATPAQTPTLIITKDSEKVLGSNVLRLTKSPPKDPFKPYRSNLKRRLEVGDDVVESSDTLTSTASSFNDHCSLNGNTQKKSKRSINFDTVEVYYFPRQQGFSCVPSAGGCTLGMGARHVAFKTLTLAEHAAELRRAHRMQLQEINPRGSSSDDSEESEEDYLSEGSGSDLDGESNGFLQPVSPKQRRALLKAAGIRKIDPSEKAECRNIRNSREVCGCSCRDFCDPETCSCSQSGIKCQVDRDMFPCGCSRDACGNTIGRVEFNPTRVRTHYIHTLMRLEMENRQQQNPYSSVVVSPLQSTPSSYYQTHLQPQSNYSSGYASPAYNTASEIHQQTAAGSYYHSPNPSNSNGLYGQQTSLEMTHNGIVATTATTSHYGIDSLDASLFGGTTATTPSYGELMPVTASYHYGNVQTQPSPYNSYHSTAYINANNNTTSLSTSNTYSSCAVPSVPPFGTATTTEATGAYHSVRSLPSLETTTAPSCSVDGTTSLENDQGASFINLSTPLASSTRLSQINDLLQHNRNATTALVAVSQNIENIDNKLNLTDSSSLCTAINEHHTENAHKSCGAFEELVSPLKSVPAVSVNEDEHSNGHIQPTELTLPTENFAKNADDLSLSSSLFTTEVLPQNSLCLDEKDTTETAVSATIKEPSTIEVADGN